MQVPLPLPPEHGLSSEIVQIQIYSYLRRKETLPLFPFRFDLKLV
ncbi:hypothetical protein HOLDEFILI_00666 [Holdemania filiformis DSM 12042]|uniref:Uncharacterized protein n=1 Tax=Holdemania filiformis DSM 12042 TaxID=545696 RepID=B9Y4D5_9FIRM|nr:hypothetical protein HOLDEFILI_00666 [Holdemania filiformis DSM 12042]